MKTSDRKSILMLSLTAIIWGAAFVAQSVGMDYVGPFTFNAARSFLGGLVLIPFILLTDRLAVKNGGRSSAPATREEKRTLLMGGILCGAALCAASGAQQMGIAYTTVGKAGFITALYIVLVPVAGIFLGNRPGRGVWMGVALAVAGLYLLCITDGFSIGGGDLLMLLCAAFFSLQILLVDHFSPRVDCVRLACLQFMVSGVLSLILMFLAGERPAPADLAAAWAPILYAGVLSSGVGYTLQAVGQKNTDPTIASLAMSLESVVSVLAGWVLLGQALSLREAIGCLLMFVAIVLAQLPARFPAGAAAAVSQTKNAS